MVSILPGRVFVLQTLPGTPSALAGMQPGDEILAINGIPLARLGVEQLVALLSEARRSKVRLDMRRPGASGLFEVTMTPRTMESESVDLAFHLTGGIGYVRIKQFEADTGVKKRRRPLRVLAATDLKGLVLDLRGNRGGIMGAALETAALFLEPGKSIVSVRGREGDPEEIDVPDDAKPYRFELALLIDGDSASGSEIVAGAIQDHDRAAIVGLPSFGKGLVQQVFPLTDNTGLALTTAFYYTPSGRSIQRPLEGGQLDPQTTGNDQVYRTDSGREVRGGGGIHPDYILGPPPMSRLRMVLEASGAYQAFAAQVIPELGRVEESFTVDSDLLDKFQVWLVQRAIQPSISEWSTDREWIRSRLRQEIFNQTIGVAQGDQVELRRDPEVKKALELLED